MLNPRSWPRAPRPLKEVMQAMPIMVTMKSSGAPKLRTRGRTMGIETAKTAAPIRAPTSELIRAAPSARPASPRLAMG